MPTTRPRYTVTDTAEVSEMLDLAHRLEQDLAQFRDLRVDAETFAAAGSAQRELARTGRHRVPVADLLIAACAQQHTADVVHVDRRFELLSSVLHFNAIRM